MNRRHPLQEQVEPCPFCKLQPELSDWPGRQLQVLIHKCRVVHLDRSAFPSDVQAMVDEWNREVASAKQATTAASSTLVDVLARMEALKEDMDGFVAVREPHGVKR